MPIGTYAENSLHAALKAYLASPGDQVEALVDGYHIDVVSGDTLIEIQTRNFAMLKTKLGALLQNHPVRLVYPIPYEKTIIRLDADLATELSRRRSPKHGDWVDVFAELVSFPALMSLPNFTLELLLVRQSELLCPAEAPLPNGGKPRAASWRRKGWRVHDRALLGVVERRVLAAPADFLALLPAGLAEPFTARELARALKRPPRLAQKAVYCLRHMGLIEQVGSRGRSYLYAFTPERTQP